jgi:hypothetical protein
MKVNVEYVGREGVECERIELTDRVAGLLVEALPIAITVLRRAAHPGRNLADLEAVLAAVDHGVLAAISPRTGLLAHRAEAQFEAAEGLLARAAPPATIIDEKARVG